MEKNRSPRDTALRYLSSRDRTGYEVKKQLKEKGFSGEEIAGVLEYLEENHLIDDKDYCERFIRYSMEKGRGPIRISRDLAEKGVSPQLFQQTLEEQFGGSREYELALDQAEKIMKGMENVLEESEGDLDHDAREMSISEEGKERTDEAGKKEKQLARLARRLASQGFRPDVIYRIIGRQR